MQCVCVYGIQMRRCWEIEHVAERVNINTKRADFSGIFTSQCLVMRGRTRHL